MRSNREADGTIQTHDRAAERALAREHAGKRKTFIMTFIVVFCVCVAALTTVFSMVHKVAGINPFGEDNVVLEEELKWETLISTDSPFYEAFLDSKRINILMLGVNPPLTDTIMLLSFDTENKHLDVISVPRDTYYHRDGYDSDAENKINAAYKGNPVNSAKAVSDVLLGMPINYYVVLEYDDVKEIVDTMGGVPVTVDVKGGMHYRDPYDKPPLVIDIPEGDVLLDGEHAVQFLRYRKGYAEGDLGRVKAQQQFIRNAFKQALTHDLLKVIKVAFDTVDSDITWGVAAQVASKAIGMSGDEIVTYTIPNTPQDRAPYYVYPEAEGIEAMINEIYSIGTETATEGGITEGAISEGAIEGE